MATVATVSAITAPRNGLGVYVPDRLCRVPEGASVVEPKYCENCGRPFVRKYHATQAAPETTLEHLPVSGKGQNHAWEFVAVTRAYRRDVGPKYCAACCERMLLPPNDEDYRAMRPDLADAARGTKALPNYDDSLLPKEQEVPRRHKYGHHKRRGHGRPASAATVRLYTEEFVQERLRALREGRL